MGEYLIQGSSLIAIANAIRIKTSATNQLTLDDMASAISTITTFDGAVIEFPIVNSYAQAYLAASDVYADNDRSTTVITDYMSDTQYDRPLYAEITVSSDGMLYIQDEITGKGFISNVSIGTNNIYNLIPNHVYQWIVKDINGNITDSGRFKPTGTLRMLYLSEIHNVRDLGGWPCDGGAIKYGLLIRGATYNNSVSEANKKRLSDIGIKLHVDLQSDTGITESPFGNSVHYLKAPLSTQYANLIKPDSVDYDTVVNILNKIMDSVIFGECVYINCYHGSDRTGTIIYMLESLLGMSNSDKDKDYEMSTFYIYHVNGSSRQRTNDEYNAMIDYLNGLNGDTFTDKVVLWFVDAGFSIDKLNAFRNAMIDGNPNILTNPYEQSQPTYTNLVQTSQAVDSTDIYNDGTGYKDEYYISSSSGNESSKSGHVVTGMIPYNMYGDVKNEDDATAMTIYIKGAEPSRIGLYSSSKSFKSLAYDSLVQTELGTNYYSLTPVINNSTNVFKMYEDYGSIRYIRLDCIGSGSNLIVTIGEPIE